MRRCITRYVATVCFLSGVVLLMWIYQQSGNEASEIHSTRPPVTLKSPFLANCTAANCDPIATIRQLASSGPRLYLHDFELNLLLFEAQKVNSTAYWLNSSTPSDFANIDDVVFIIMSSSVTKSKAKNLVSSWLQLAKNFYFFTDQNDSTIPNFMTLPELFNKSTRDDAQHRQLRGMKWLRANKPEISSKNWFALVDDDTWLNIPALLHFLHPYSPELPLNFGYVWENAILGQTGAVQCGGAGMVLSRNAFQQLADHLYTKTFNFQWLNDITLANGCKALGILMVHSDKFFWNQMIFSGNKLPTDYVAKITHHYVNDPNFLLRMTCSSALFWRFPPPQNCNLTD